MFHLKTNNWFSSTLLFGFAAMAMFACKKDEDRVIVSAMTTPTLSVTSNNVVLDRGTQQNPAVTFNWTPASFNWSNGNAQAGAIRYVIQFDTTNTFSTPRELVGDATVSRSLTGAQVNSVATGFGLEAEKQKTMYARVGARLGENVTPEFSNIITFAVTPYSADLPKVFVPGAHQGWTPATAPALVAVTGVSQFEGFVNFPDNNTEFKITRQPGWDGVAYGAGSSAGMLSTEGSNLKIAEAGYYLLKVNTATLTWTATRTAWGVIGDATADGWNSDQDLTYDPAEKIWKATLNLTAGELKFRANDAWDLNFGRGTGNNTLSLGGPNIPVGAAGRYDVILNLSDAAGYTYQLRKL